MKLLNNIINLYPVNKILGYIYIPGSKSITNRILLLIIIFNNLIIKNILLSDDTFVMIKILKKFGFKFKKIKNNLLFYNYNKFFLKKVIFYINNAGTIARGLIPLLFFINNKVLLYGSYRMNKRPIKFLINCLNKINYKINYIKYKNYFPIIINKTNLNIKKNFLYFNIIGNISSQFITSLLLTSFILKKKYIYIKIINNLISKSYITLTLKLINKFNLYVLYKKKKKLFIIPPFQYINNIKLFNIESDATSVAYFLTMGGLKINNYIKIYNIKKNNIQGEYYFINILKKMNFFIKNYKNYLISKSLNLKLKPININCNNIPDSSMILCIISIYTSGVNIIRNIYSWNIKETNRLLVIYNEIKKFGIKCNIGNNYIKIISNKNINYVNINTYNDHRIAMIFTLLSINNYIIKCPYIKIFNHNCVNKTFPNYFLIFNKVCKF